MLRLASRLVALAALPTVAFAGTDAGADPGPSPRVGAVKVVILSTMLADSGIGEWGFSALVEADGHRILFDTGARPDTVLRNARELGVDLAGVRDVVLSHHHDDHTGGLVALRREYAKSNPDALSRAWVGRGMFLPRIPASPTGGMPAVKAAYEADGGRFVELDGPRELFPGVWLTGPVPRVHPERNWSGTDRIQADQGAVEDNLPEDQALVLDTDRGLVVLFGCGHAGVVNTLTHARHVVRDTPVHAVLGGLHLYEKDDAALDWTADRLRELGVASLLGAHCTGLEAVYHLDAQRRARPQGRVPHRSVRHQRPRRARVLGRGAGGQRRGRPFYLALKPVLARFDARVIANRRFLGPGPRRGRLGSQLLASSPPSLLWGVEIIAGADAPSARTERGAVTEDRCHERVAGSYLFFFARAICRQESVVRGHPR